MGLPEAVVATNAVELAVERKREAGAAPARARQVRRSNPTEETLTPMDPPHGL